MIELRLGDFEHYTNIAKDRYHIWDYHLSKKENEMILNAKLLKNDKDEATLDSAIGEGNLVLLGGGTLIINDSSHRLGAIPEIVMRQFAELVKKEHGDKYNMDNIQVNPVNENLKTALWLDLGFCYGNAWIEMCKKNVNPTMVKAIQAYKRNI